MTKKFYSWHRSLSVIIAIPVLLWAASGFMHPLMTNIRPKLATQTLQPLPLDSNRIKISLPSALQRNHITAFSYFRFVHIDTNWFYQVQLARQQPPVYLSTLNGNKLAAGDWLYAQYLAREFLEGQDLPGTSATSTTASAGPTKGASPISGSTATNLIPPATVSLALTAAIPPATPQIHDCCGAATECVLNPVKGAKVTNVSFQQAFDDEYKSINRILPVYRVNFDRADGIRVYVETSQDRFAFAMDNKRAVFDRIFTLIHTWGWLEFLGKGKFIVEGLLALLALCTALMGIVLFFTTKTKKVKGNGLVKARRNHRYTSIVIALFTLMFTFSGSFHAFSKLKDDDRDRFFADPSFTTAGLQIDLARIQTLAKAPVCNIRPVKMYGKTYLLVSRYFSPKKSTLPPAPPAPPTPPADLYLETDSLSGALNILPQGEEQYARFLAGLFRGKGLAEDATLITRFNSEYNFADKRLPVWKVSYGGKDNERYYIETSTGRLAKRVTNSSLVEEYSFAFLHKHEFMSWGGKGLKDLSTMFWALAQIVLVTIGLLLYFKWRKRRTGRI